MTKKRLFVTCTILALLALALYLMAGRKQSSPTTKKGSSERTMASAPTGTAPTPNNVSDPEDNGTTPESRPGTMLPAHHRDLPHKAIPKIPKKFRNAFKPHRIEVPCDGDNNGIMDCSQGQKCYGKVGLCGCIQKVGKTCVRVEKDCQCR